MGIANPLEEGNIKEIPKIKFLVSLIILSKLEAVEILIQWHFSISDYILRFIFINSVILFSLSSSILLEDFAVIIIPSVIIVENEEVGSDEDSKMELVMNLMW